MDLRSLCSKLDVDAIRAKIPPLPQIKLPKSMSKLRSRKIFRSSRENVNANSRRASSKRIPANSENLPLPLGPPYTIPPSEFINRTPTRISTVSSLMNQNSEDREGSRKWKSKTGNDESFYRSAGGIEDYYPSPLNQRFEHLSRPISPVRAPAVSQDFRAQSDLNVKMSIGERLQKGYKDVTEFKLKHLFAKKTVVRTDQIEITEYIHRFDKDRKREERVQEKFDRDIADNYRFQFKISKQNSEESYLESPDSSPQTNKPKKNPKTLSELSGDESGMELSPPTRKPGIASTRFSRVRHTPLNMSLEEDNDDNDSIHVVEEIASNIKASKRSSKKSKNSIDSDKSFGARQTSFNMSFDEDDDDNDDGVKLDVVDENSPKIKHNTSSLYDIKKQKSPATFEKKGKAPLTPQQSEENNADSLAAPTKSDKPFDAIKHNFKRLQKSIKLPQQMHSGAESENDEANPESNTKQSKTQQFTERLRRFRSTDHVNKNSEDGEDNLAPIHKFTHKIQEWKRSIKQKVDTQNDNDNDDDYRTNSPQKQDKPVGSLIKKLKHIRSRKRDSIEDPDDDEEGGETYKESLAARAKLQLEKGKVVACQMPQITRKKISETKQYFKKKQEPELKQNPDKPKTDEEDLDGDRKVTVSQPAIKSIPRPPPPIPRPYFHYSSEEEGSDDQDRFIAKSIAESKLIAVPAGRAAWTTKPILSEDATDYDDELPRVLLHQDNSDVFESTLIIAVTRPISRNTTPIITELPPDFTEEESKRDTKPDNWIPNQDLLPTFLEMTPPTHRKLSKDSNDTFNLRAHSRKLSIDSSSEDSWIKDIPKGPSTAVLNSVYENEIPWKIQKGNSEDHLYKTKSIDLFEMQKKHGGALTAFEDFDYELKNTPVVKIETDETKYGERDERESSEELDNPDDDNSSRVTKISVRTQEIKNNESEKFKQKLKSQSYGNSQESLTGNLDDEDIIDSGEEDDNEESDEDDENVNEIHEQDDVDIDLPPSKAPSPPPSISQPPPPPLPERQPSLKLSKLNISPSDLACPSEPPPPLPLTKPPVPPNRPTPPPPKIPERNPPTTRTSKPLVKTASLRLAYSEQVKPQDVGKVNKLISRFEPEGPKQRPRIVPRKPITSESEEYSDEEDSFELLPTVNERDNTRDTTPTNHPRLQKSFSIDSVDLPYNNNKLSPLNQKIDTPPTRKATSEILLDNSDSAIPIPSISISPSCLDINSNLSQPSSVYGSPLAYPSSLIGSTEATPLTNRKNPEHLSTTRRNRRSMARDDEHFYSFDSDEENSYYSISSTSSNRYVVEL